MATQIFTVPIIVNIAPPIPATIFRATAQINIIPEETPSQTLEVKYPLKINVVPITLNLSDAIIKSANTFLTTAINQYIDEDRELKTLLNYGDDRQSVILAQRPGTTPRSIQLKLLQPVPTDINVDHKTFLVREVVSSVIDKFRVRFAPLIDDSPYLRPFNASVQLTNAGRRLKNVTLNKLSLSTGSFGGYEESNNISFEDQILRRWFSDDFNSAELNIDFTDYKNFVFYSSAEMRLDAFKQKLLKIESLDAQRLQFSGSVFTGSLASAGAIFILNQSAESARQKEEIIRGFDRYEQYLYFTPSGSSSPYTASFDYVDGGIEYNPIGYWPKNSSGTLYTVYSNEGQSWFDTQKAIAARYDEFNVNYLANTIPTHIREQADNTAYITFVSMVGHFFDTIKLYVDQFPNISSRFPNPNEELSKDLINEIAESFGFTMPTLNSVYDLSNTILGTEFEEPRRDYTAETYKRILHNLSFFSKAKGTKASLNALLRSLGISPQLMSIRESGTPTTSSYTLVEEFSTGININRTTESYIKIPISASNRDPKALQVNLTAATDQFMVLLNGDTRWAVRLRPSTSQVDYGRLEITSGSGNTLIAESSYYNLYGDDLFNFTIQTDSTSSKMQLMKVDAQDILFSESIPLPSTFYDLWKDTQYVYLGGSGSLRIAGYDGTIDEVRLWGTKLEDAVITSSVFNPGANFGNTYTDARQNLYVQVSMNQQTISGSYIQNESPYVNKLSAPSLQLLTIESITTGSLARYSRTAKEQSILLGPSAFITNKVRIAPDPVFYQDSIAADGSKLLSPRKSIVRPEQKPRQVGKNKITLSVSPTNIINQNIVRNIGYENVNRVLGLPSNYYSFTLTLDKLKQYYNKNYPVTVNLNQYIRLMSEVTAVVDQLVDYFVPAKATVIKGITIEQNILEKIRIASIKNIRGYGAGTRKTDQAAGSLTGSRADYGATFNLKKTIEVKNTLLPSGKVDSVISSIDTQDTTIVSATSDFLKTQISLPSTEELVAKSNTLTSTLDNKKAETYASYATITSSLQRQAEIVTGSSSTFKSTVTVTPVSPQGSNITVTSSIEQKLPETIFGDSNTKTARVDLYDNENIIKSNFLTYPYQHVPWDEYRYASGSSEYEFKPDKLSSIDLRLSAGNKIKYNSTNKGSPGAEPYNRVYTRKLFDYEITTPRLGGNTSLYTNALYEIRPSADFTDFGVITYFNQENGVYTFPETKKTPVYPKPLNQTWSEVSQSFIGSSTWQYGNKYNAYDVVYQNVTTSDVELGHLTSSAKSGNGKYYVFTTRPSYTAPTDGTSYYLGQVPSYVPPSLDTVNWQLLKFKPTEVRIPRRVIYDTFTVPTPVLNNYKTTTIDVNKIINIPARYVDTLPVQLVGGNSQITGEIVVQNILALFALQSNNSDLRVRLYRTSENRTADLTRPYNVQPTGSHGVLLDSVLATSDILELTNPIPILVAGGSPPKATIYYTIDNLTSVAKAGTQLLMYYYALQIEPRIPFGYLRKHYRFFRDNATATKRRNWLGCKFKIIGYAPDGTEIWDTIDGKSPVQVVISEGTRLTTSKTSTSSEIQTGGGGTLNVT